MPSRRMTPRPARSPIFLVNRSHGWPTTVTIDRQSPRRFRCRDRATLSDDDIYAKNTLAEPDRVRLQDRAAVETRAGSVTVTLPAVSWTAIELRVVEVA